MNGTCGHMILITVTYTNIIMDNTIGNGIVSMLQDSSYNIIPPQLLPPTIIIDHYAYGINPPINDSLTSIATLNLKSSTASSPF